MSDKRCSKFKESLTSYSTDEIFWKIIPYSLDSINILYLYKASTTLAQDACQTE